jgi:two-component system C4-dicarboxylate transport sensor histidine kinase DctB
VDRIRLEQVIVNLLQNALDAVKDHAAPRIIVETEADAAGVAIAVMDNGPGVPEDIERELFTPFRSTKTSGLGLGLVISRDIVAEFAGSLEYAPPAAGGARFVVRIPRVA